jgi:hypothetical protein
MESALNQMAGSMLCPASMINGLGDLKKNELPVAPHHNHIRQCAIDTDAINMRTTSREIKHQYEDEDARAMHRTRIMGKKDFAQMAQCAVLSFGVQSAS